MDRMSGSRGNRRLPLALTLIVAVTLLSFGAWVPAASAQAATSAQALAATTDATTGLNDAGSLTAQDACSPASPGHATCLAEVLVLRSDREAVHPRLRAASSPERTAGTATAVLPAASAPQAGSPAYLQQAYDLSYLSQNAGGGDTVAVVDAYDDPTAESDLAVYRAQFGLPACTTQSGCFRKVDQTGGTNYPTADSSWDTEISLDLDAVSALCPNCQILLVEANTNSYSDLDTAMQEADALGASQISDSWGGIAGSPPAGTYSFTGVETVAATGDDGYPGAGQDQYPAALPGVTAAGGTSLTPASASGTQTARGFTEQGWSGAGSGCDTAETKPAWQTDTGCTGRAYADLSADADPNTGMDVYDTSGQSGWIVVGGTSEATPLISAYYALTGVAAQSPGWAWQNASELNDPAGGSNDGTYSCAQSIAYICDAGAGYDGPTGAGSISGDVVAGAPGIGGPNPNGSYIAASNGTTVQLEGGVYPNGLATTWWVQYGTSTAYGQQTTPAAVNSGPGAQTVTGTLSGLTLNTTYHYRLVAQNADGISYGYDYTLTAGQSAPAVSSPQAADVTGTSAILGAQLNTGEASTTYTFQWGTTTLYGQSTSQTVSAGQDGAISAQLTGLAPDTTYHYEVTATNPNGTASSGDETFTTQFEPPQVIALQAYAQSSTEVTLTATVTGEGSATSYAFQFGATPSLGNSTPAGTVPGSGSWEVAVTLSGLAPGTTYYYELVAQNAGGSTVSPMQWFTTPAAPGSGGSALGGPNPLGTPPANSNPLGSNPVTPQPVPGRASVTAASLWGARGSVTVHCAGASECKVAIKLARHGKVLAGSSATVAAGRSVTVRLKLNAKAAAAARRGASAILLELKGGRWVRVASRGVRHR